MHGQLGGRAPAIGLFGLEEAEKKKKKGANEKRQRQQQQNTTVCQWRRNVRRRILVVPSKTADADPTPPPTHAHKVGPPGSEGMRGKKEGGSCSIRAAPDNAFEKKTSASLLQLLMFNQSP